MTPHLIVSDLDGTLLGANHDLAEVTVQTLRELAALGHHVALASGRHHLDMLPFCERLGGDVHLISSNGAWTFDPAGQRRQARYLAPALARALIDLPRPPQVRLNLYRDNAWLIDDHAPGLLDLHDATGFAYQVQASPEMNEEGVGKALYIGMPDDLALIEAEARELAGEQLHITYSMAHSLEIMAAGVNKGTAVSELLDYLGLPATRCLAFGDNLNDREMLALAGEAQVMANAHPSLAQDLPESRVIGHHRDAAVALWLRERFALDR
ncbi:Cof-type HAD-IIB family hydrolase [Halomonas sp. V046]|uniref:Cof-type HAD-IIB family hydrolase n=1 Tax=Halomonas sp. V046 TaxID=3459611 RepID=UPI004044FA95